MPRLLGLAELLDRSLDAMFDERFPENGSFVTRTRTNREGVSRHYWYDQGYRTGPAATDDAPKRYALYLGPTDDPVIDDRVRRFAELRQARGDRGRLVDALAGAGMPRLQAVSRGAGLRGGLGAGPTWRDLIARGVARLPASTRRAIDVLALPFGLPA